MCIALVGLINMYCIGRPYTYVLYWYRTNKCVLVGLIHMYCIGRPYTYALYWYRTNKCVLHW